MNFINEIIDSLKNHPDDWEAKDSDLNHKKYLIKIYSSGNIFLHGMINGRFLQNPKASYWQRRKITQLLKVIIKADADKYAPHSLAECAERK